MLYSELKARVLPLKGFKMNTHTLLKKHYTAGVKIVKILSVGNFYSRQAS